MSNTRRERYAFAIASYLGHIPGVDGPVPEGYFAAADAAMKVADEEIKELTMNKEGN